MKSYLMKIDDTAVAVKVFLKPADDVRQVTPESYIKISVFIYFTYRMWKNMQLC